MATRGGAGDAAAADGGARDDAFREMARSFSQMGFTMNFQSQTANVTFNGKPKNYKRWIQDLDRIVLSSGVLEGERDKVYKQVAWETARGQVAEVIGRRSRSHPNETWDQLQKELKTRFGPTVERFRSKNVSVAVYASPRSPGTIPSATYKMDVGFRLLAFQKLTCFSADFKVF